MAVPVAALAKIAAAALSDEDTRKRLGWIVAAICSPLILTLALICALLSGSAEHNNSAVLLCFNGGTIPNKTPAEYVAYIEDMRRCFTLLDDAIAAVNGMTENSNSLDGIRVKAVFYAIFFGEDTPSRRAHRQFVDCFVTYEECARLIKKQREVFGSGYRKKPQNMTRTAALRFRNTQKRSRANKNRIQPTGTPRTRNVSPGRFLFENLSFSQVKSRRK